MIIGTSHFRSVGHAERYYSGYGYDDVTRAVRQKLDDGEIHLGPAPLKPGDAGYWDVDGRYHIDDGRP